MSTIVQAVQGFLREMEWNWEQLDERRLRVLVSGDNGRWTWMAAWSEYETLFISYSICPSNVPQSRRLAVSEFLTLANYGLSLGNFELDFRDGEVRFKTSVPLKKDKLSRSMVRELAFCGFSLMDRYMPSLMSVAFGKANPKKAIEAAERPTEAGSESADDEEEAEPVDRAARIVQFTDYLKRMYTRTADEAKTPCFLIFARQTKAPSAEQTPRKGRSRSSKGAASPGDSRFVQFYFCKDWFAMEIPNTTIVPREAERLLRDREGFYREAEKPDADVNGVVDVVEFDPVGKRYSYGQEQEAAEDAAWVFFDLWRLDPGERFSVSASSFESDHRWEQDELLK
jgi:hypothetical protein